MLIWFNYFYILWGSNSYKGKIVMRRKRLTKKSNIVAIPIKVRLLSNQNYKIDL